MYDCALFDVDGVLVDIRKSYNSAVKKTIEYMHGKLAGRPYRGLVTDRLILRFRESGGFNNDTDTAYAITLAVLTKSPASMAEAGKILFEVAANADASGIASVEKYLEPFGADKWKKQLAYPAPVQDSMIARVFDELFYGPELFKKRYGLEPKYWRGRPLIGNDVRVVSALTLNRLCQLFGGRLAMVTGRSILATRYSLGTLMQHFDLKACVFLEDEKREYAKPSTYAIRRAMQGMGANSAVYAGDSAEDLMMARRAEEELGAKIEFVGIYGYSPQPSKTAANFRELGVNATLKTVNQLPALVKAMQ